MKVLRINAVATSKKKKKYATTAAGVPLFGNKNIELVVGDYAIVDTVQQTHNYNADGTIGAPLDTPVLINQIKSVWKTREEAIENMHEDQINEIHADAFLQKARKAAGFDVKALVASGAGVEA